MKRLAVLGLCCIGGFASAEQVSDAVLAECQGESPGYDRLADCLPQTQVASELLAMVPLADFYGDAGADLVQECRGMNTSTPATWSCVMLFIHSAASVGSVVSDLSKIEDARTRAFADPAVNERLHVHLQDSMSAFGRSPRIRIPDDTALVN